MVKIVCAAPVDLIEQQKFSLALFKQLRLSVIKIPCLATLLQEDLLCLIEGCSIQAVADQSSLQAVQLSEHKQSKFIAHGPDSIEEFKERLKNILRTRMHKNNIVESVFNTTYEYADPILA